jgi:hypothetical protein
MVVLQPLEELVARQALAGPVRQAAPAALSERSLAVCPAPVAKAAQAATLAPPRTAEQQTSDPRAAAVALVPLVALVDPAALVAQVMVRAPQVAQAA